MMKIVFDDDREDIVMKKKVEPKKKLPKKLSKESKEYIEKRMKTTVEKFEKQEKAKENNGI